MPEPLQTSTTISHYRLLEKLGAGGMGEVFLAEDTRLHRKVALKILPENIASDADRLRRFEQEAFAASALNHPNILTIHEFAQTGGVHFLATEFVEGRTLREAIGSGELSLTEALTIAEQTASALAAAHEAGIVHRDIKPENIMVRRDLIVKVLDFGLAKLTEKKEARLDSEAETRALVRTTPGMIMGTAAYMSPEQARGKEIDARTDIWSLGVCLYEMLTGKQPFPGETVTDTLAAILHLEPAPLVKNTPQELQRIIRKALQKNQDERYQTAKDFLIDLKNLKRELEFAAEIHRSSIPSVTKFRDAGTNSSSENATAMTPTAVSTENSLPQPVSSAEYQVSDAEKNKRGVMLLGALVLLALLGVGLWFFFPRFPADSAPIDSIAVVPFQNRSSDADTEYLSEGLAESLIYRFSQLPNLKVSPTSSVFRYKDKETDAQKIGSELGVSAVMTGRIAQRGDNLMISVELVDVRTGKLIWGEQYDRKVSDLLATQREIAAEITQRLKLKLSGAEEKSTRRYTESNEAYQLYLKGRFYWNRRTESDVKKGIEYFRQAVDADPKFALAWAGLADSYGILPAYSETPTGEFKEKIREAATKALELDPNLAEAHSSYGWFLANYEWNFAEADRAFQRAIALNPNYATAHHWFSLTLSWRLRHDEALKESKQGLEIEPLSRIINSNYGEVLLYAGQIDKAIEQIRRTLELYPDFAHGHRGLALAMLKAGKYQEAIHEQNQAIALGGGRLPLYIAELAYINAMAGNKGEAEKLLKELLERKKTEPIGNYNLAVVYAGLGDKDKALEYLEKAYHDRSYRMPYIIVYPYFDSLRDDPRYKALIRRIALLE